MLKIILPVLTALITTTLNETTRQLCEHHADLDRKQGD